jgi:bifunctional DNA-binding transcriptional regulator/antitoxin component of YhaV-PrlF toxin-antitoxin module
MTTILMDSSGRLVLPKVIRERLNLAGGVSMRAEVVAGRVELTPVETPGETGLSRKGGITVLRRTGVKADSAAAVAAERDSLAERGSRR